MAHLDQVGVNTHFGQGQPWEKAGPALASLGIRHIRDDAPPANPAHAYASLATAGLKLCALTGALALPSGADPKDFVARSAAHLEDVITRLESYEASYPGTLAAIEGQNEPNARSAITHDGKKGMDAAIAWQDDLYDRVKASARLCHLPVYQFSGQPNAAGRADVFNVHPYPDRKHSLADKLADSTGPGGRHVKPGLLSKGRVIDPARLMVVTETGRSTNGTYSPQDQATRIMADLTGALALGVLRVYLYQLSDFYADPSGRTRTAHYGLFDINYQPKPIVAALADFLRQ